MKWSPAGAADGELVFVSGHPGATDRLSTVAQLETERDLISPISIDVVSRRIAALRKYGAQGAEQARQAAGTLFSLENALKAERGEYQGLLDARLMEKKRKEEQDFRARIDANREWKTLYGDAWDAIAAAENVNRALYKASRFQQLRGSSLASLATSLLRYIDEKQKPDAERLNGYHDAQLQGLELQLFSPAPVYPALDEALLADALQQSFEELGAIGSLQSGGVEESQRRSGRRRKPSPAPGSPIRRRARRSRLRERRVFGRRRIRWSFSHGPPIPSLARIRKPSTIG